MTKTALITGISGQDGSYLAELLLEKGYHVHGLVRQHSQPRVYGNLTHIQSDLRLHHGDLTDSHGLHKLIDRVRPDEIYNLAAQTHVSVSFAIPETTSEINALGPLKLLESIRSLGAEQHVKFYQASTSEIFGKTPHAPQNEQTAFYPASPYGIAKLYAHWLTINYRESYQMFACAGILFNHESPRRGEQFVTRKITQAFARIKAGLQSHVELGNLDSLRDWGHAKDYVQAMWLMLQQPEPADYVIATGVQYSVRDFCNMVAEYHGMKLAWQGEGPTEQAVNMANNQVVIRVNPEFYRPTDVINLLGDATLARTKLNWRPTYGLPELVQDMCASDWKQVSS